MSKMSRISKFFLVISILFISIIVFFYNPYNFDFKHYELVDWPRMVEILKEKHPEIVDMKYVTTRTSKFNMKTKVDVIINGDYTEKLEGDIQIELFRISLIREGVKGYLSENETDMEKIKRYKNKELFIQEARHEYNSSQLSEEELDKRSLVGLPIHMKFQIQVSNEQHKNIKKFSGECYDNKSYWDTSDLETNKAIHKEITFEDFFD